VSLLTAGTVVQFDREQSALVAERLREAFVSDLQVASGELHACPAGVTPRALDRLEALVADCRAALDLLACGEAEGHVELAAGALGLERLAGGFVDGGADLIANAEAYVDGEEGFESVEAVIERGLSEIALGNLIRGVSGVGRRHAA
jgi:hypothetical protein